MSGASGAGRLHYEQPVITVMPGHKEQGSFVELQQTLSQLGFDSGSALLKLSYKNSGTPLEEAMAQITQYFKTGPASAGAEGAHASTTDQLASIPDPDQAAPEATEVVAGQTIRNDEPDPEPMDVDSAPVAEPVTEPEVSTEHYAGESIENTSSAAALAAATSTASSAPAQTDGSSSQPSSTPDLTSPLADKSRNIQIFSAPTSSTPQAARNAFNPNDYLPSIEHAKVHQAALLNKTRNSRLPSDKEIEEIEKERQAKIDAAAERGGALRVRMPDGALIQMPLNKVDTAAGLYDNVRGFLEKKDEPFLLKNTGATGRLVLIPQDEKRLVHDLRFFNNELITFQWADSASDEARASRNALSKEWTDKATALKVEEPDALPQTQSQGQTVAEGKRKAVMSNEEKESKLKNLLGKGLFKKK
jgi:tether containing UBX domain for GLUT4